MNGPHRGLALHARVRRAKTARGAGMQLRARTCALAAPAWRLSLWTSSSGFWRLCYTTSMAAVPTPTTQHI